MTAQMSFEEIAVWADDLPADEKVYADTTRGHIRVGELIFADMGAVLDVWSYCGVDLTPATARELGEALIAWAERKAQPSTAPQTCLDGAQTDMTRKEQR